MIQDQFHENTATVKHGTGFKVLNYPDSGLFNENIILNGLLQGDSRG